MNSASRSVLIPCSGHAKHPPRHSARRLRGLHLIELGGIGPGRIGGGDNFAGFGREQLGDGRQRSRVAADRPTLERRYVSVSRLLSDRARPRFSSPRQAGDRDPPLPVEREAGRSGWLTGNASHAEPSKISYRNIVTTAADALRQSAHAA